MNYKCLVFLLILLSIFSCKKAEDRRCLKSNGRQSSKIVELPEFTKLDLKKGIEYILVQDGNSYIEIFGGKNLLNFIETSEIETGKIRIENKNKCNFLRKYSSTIRVEIHFNELIEMRYEGTENLSNKDTIVLNDFKFEVVDACGSLNLILKANKIMSDIPDGFGDYTLSGVTNIAELSAKSNGFCNTENLKVLSELTVSNESQGDMYINADQNFIKGSITGAGNIYYKGTSLGEKINYYSTGRLIKN